MASFHAMRNRMQGKIIQHGGKDCITHSQLFVLDIIEQHPHTGIKEISKKLNISSSAATQLVDALVENGYVTRHADSKDRRALQLDLSSSGRNRLITIKQAHREAIGTLFDVLSDEELEAYLTLHKKILS